MVITLLYFKLLWLVLLATTEGELCVSLHDYDIVFYWVNSKANSPLGHFIRI